MVGTMIMYQLKCSSGHEFEAWFRNSAGYDDQRAVGAVSCPICGDQEIGKALMAPAVGKKSSSRTVGPYERRAAEVAREVLAAAERVREHVEENCDYVGTRFAEEARKIYYGETEERGIYGEATDQDNRELTEEGIDVFRLPNLPRRNGN